MSLELVPVPFRQPKPLTSLASGFSPPPFVRVYPDLPILLGTCAYNLFEVAAWRRYCLADIDQVGS